MVWLTRLSNTQVLLNSDLIETIETTPDTVVRLSSGQTLMVQESPELLLAKIVEFRRSILCGPRSPENCHGDLVIAPSLDLVPPVS